MSSSSFKSLEEESNINILYQEKEPICLSGFSSPVGSSISDWFCLEEEEQETNTKKILFEQNLYSPGSGEICAKYIAQSNSAMLPDFYYPAVQDPGIKNAILGPIIPETTLTQSEDYSNDGQKLYLALCKEINTCPVRLFHTGLSTSEINLSYYGVSSLGILPMAMALRYNKNVEKFNLTDNFLNHDACYHLGQMLGTNVNLRELNMAGCRIGAAGLRRLGHRLHINRKLTTLNLAGNDLREEGGTLLVEMIVKGVTLKRFYLSKNSLGKETALALADVFLYKDTITHLDLSMNNLFHSPSIAKLLHSIAYSFILKELNLAWNQLQGLLVAGSIKKLMLIPTLKILDLSNNKFSGEAVTIIVSGIFLAKKLTTINLSSNPLNPSDALIALQTMLIPKVKLKNLLMNNVLVEKKFMLLLDQVKKMESRENCVVTFDKVIEDWTIKGPDTKELILKRVDYLVSLVKKPKINVINFFWSLYEENPFIAVKELIGRLAYEHVPLDDDLVDELANVFPGTKSAQGVVNLKSLCEYMLRLWPNRKFPTSLISAFKSRDTPKLDSESEPKMT